MILQRCNGQRTTGLAVLLRIHRHRRAWLLEAFSECLSSRLGPLGTPLYPVTYHHLLEEDPPLCLHCMMRGLQWGRKFGETVGELRAYTLIGECAALDG